MNARAFSSRCISILRINFCSKRFCSFTEEIEELIDDREYKDIRSDFIDLSSPFLLRNAFVVQPRVKWGPQKDFTLNHELLLQETISLVETLQNWQVKGSLVMSTTSLKRKGIFGEGNLDKVINAINGSNSNVAVFSTDFLSSIQQNFLEKYLSVPVFDRYSIVLKIFNDHAKTKEAKLQIALAEIPYIQSKLKSLHENRDSFLVHKIGGPKGMLFDDRKKILRDREAKLKKALEVISKNRELLKVARVKKQIPSVAVVGYTNAGKTSLIKAITRDESLVPKDQLFATLDVTTHAARLPNGQQALFVDTVGFISNIPISLIHAFNATLQDVASSDLVIHVYDISHPNVANQRHTVLNTLKSINVPEKLLSSIVEVANKIDCVSESELASNDSILVSATNSVNIQCLKEVVEKKVIANTGRFSRTVRVPMGGEESRWLWSEATVVNVSADPEDANVALMDVVFTNASFAKYKRRFGECE